MAPLHVDIVSPQGSGSAAKGEVTTGTLLALDVLGFDITI
jgi:hypothetical protein